MAQKYFNVAPLDPSLYTGPYRLFAGPARMGDVVLDQAYGPNGQIEFASWLYVGTTGDVSFVKWDGTTQVLTNVEQGYWHRIYSTQINSVGTDAAGLVWGS